MKLDRTRVIFLVIIGVTLIIICGALAYNFYLNTVAEPETTPVAGIVEETAAESETAPAPAQELDSPEPIFGPDYDSEGGLPTYICGADAFASYYTLQQMQMAGLDV